MGQKTNPIGNRLGIIRGWDSNWFADRDYASKVVEDEKIRRYLKLRVEKGGIARTVIERTLNKRITITIHTSRPGIIIGKQGQEVDKIREELKKLTDKDVQINILEIRKPELNATTVGETIAKQIEARINYRKAIKMAIQSTIRAGAEGIKVRISGRLNGADMARSEEYAEGRSPLHTFRADIDYDIVEAQTVYGKIGIKIWICRGEIFSKVDLYPTAGPKRERGAEGGGENGSNNDRNRDNRNRGDRNQGNRDNRPKGQVKGERKDLRGGNDQRK